MSASSRSKLNDSWIIEDIEDGDISWAEDSEPSDLEERVQVKQLKTPPKQIKVAPRQHHLARSRVKIAEPEFIMPSVGEQPGIPRSSALRQRYQVRDPVQGSRYASRTLSAEPEFRRRSASPVGDKVARMATGTFEYFFDIVLSTLKTLKRPISLMLAAYLLAGGLAMLQNLFTTTIHSALSPVCRIPGVSLLQLPICSSSFVSMSQGQPEIPLSPGTHATPEFDALMSVQTKFETILEDSISAVSLPMDMKRSEMSMRDLQHIVSVSNIPSKNELVHEFNGFLETARIASYDLMKFSNQVGRAVDLALTTARWTQNVLDDISHKNNQSNGAISDFIRNRLLAPFQPLEFTESRLLNQYIQHTRVISDEIGRVVDEAQTLLKLLENLEDRLGHIHSIALRDNISAQASRDQILSEIWTYIGRNRAKLGKVDKEIYLLNRVGFHRKLAYAHVSNMMLKLQAMNVELEGLRTRVESAEKEQRQGIEGVPLSVHIESVRLGIERLNEQREKTRGVEYRHHRNVLDRKTSHEGNSVDGKPLDEEFLIDGPRI